MKKSRTTNPLLRGLIDDLVQKTYREEAPIWREIAKRLSRSASRRTAVNLGHISRHTQKGDVVAVPGKVLGSGSLGHPITVGAYSFSETAREKIASLGGTCLTLGELSERYPEGTKIRILE
jgi:large subunit ribosomal protein L18e